MGEVVLAACADNQGILGTDLRSGALVATFEDAQSQPSAFGTIGYSTGHLFAVQSKKAIWQAWTWGDKKPSYRGSLPEKMTAMAWSHDGVLCFGGAASGSIYIWQVGTGVLLRYWPAHFRDVTQLLVSEDGGFLISASADANVHVYNLADVFAERTPKPFHSWSGHSLAVTSIALLPGSGLQQVVASASLDRSVRLWDIGTGKSLLSRSLASPVNSISVGPSGAEILCACKNGDLRTFSPRSAGREDDDGVLVGHTGPVLSCAVNGDGSMAASCSEADRVRIWDLRQRQCVSQAHASRSVQVTSVQIVRRAAHAPGLPAFTPFQRLLANAEEMPAVPLCATGRNELLADAMEPHTQAREFIDEVLWAEAGGTGGMSSAAELGRRAVEAEASAARWAAAAAELYGSLVETGEDGDKVPAAPVAPPLPAAGIKKARKDANQAKKTAALAAAQKKGAKVAAARDKKRARR